MIEFKCRHCGDELIFPDDLAGTEQTCQRCQKTVRVPSGATPGFRGDITKPGAPSSSSAETPASGLHRGAEADAGEPPVLPPSLNAMRRPPTEEVHLCIFFKWFFLIAGCAGAIALIIHRVNLYTEAVRRETTENTELLVPILTIAAGFFSGLVLYAVFACLGRIVGSLYLISRNAEGRR
jgi:hypothetical protein